MSVRARLVKHVFSSMEVFIEYVKQYPVLYNPEDKDYRDTNKKDDLWKRIVDEMKNPNISDSKLVAIVKIITKGFSYMKCFSCCSYIVM